MGNFSSIRKTAVRTAWREPERRMTLSEVPAAMARLLVVGAARVQ
jgi:DNA topoisomerase IA